MTALLLSASPESPLAGLDKSQRRTNQRAAPCGASLRRTSTLGHPERHRGLLRDAVGHAHCHTLFSFSLADAFLQNNLFVLSCR